MFWPHHNDQIIFTKQQQERERKTISSYNTALLLKNVLHAIVLSSSGLQLNYNTITLSIHLLEKYG